MSAGPISVAATIAVPPVMPATVLTPSYGATDWCVVLARASGVEMSLSKIDSPAGSTNAIETLPRAAVATMLVAFDVRAALLMPRISFAHGPLGSGAIERADEGPGGAES